MTTTLATENVWDSLPNPAWLDPAFRNGHDMRPGPDAVPPGLGEQDSQQWTCVTCGAVAEPTPHWGLPTGALAESCERAA